MSEVKKTALVTGASAGIGAEFCRQLAQRCEVIIAVGRRAEKLQELADELADKVEVHPVVADLETRLGITQVIEMLRQKGPVDYLVNNAGYSTMGNFAELELEPQQGMVDLHITATMALSRAAIPFMMERGGGAVINVSSLGAFNVLPGGAIYCASKAFLNSFSESLQAEVAIDDIRVQSLCPGFTWSEFHDREAMAGFDRGWFPEEQWQSAEQVVAESLAALTQERVIVVTGAHNQPVAEKALEGQLHRLKV
jgi:short-subunit dehydrogenase